MASERASDPSVLRLSRYHCFLGELMGMRTNRRVTSRELAQELGLSEETVRHDLKYVDIEGRPGAGYDMQELYDGIQDYLELSPGHPVVIVASADMARGLLVTFPAAQYGLSVAAYVSERPEDVGQHVGDMTVAAMSDMASIASATDVTVALVAVAPHHLEDVLDQLASAGICGALLLTPAMRPYRPAGMDVTYFRIPCALKSLAHARRLASDAAINDCCSAG